MNYFLKTTRRAITNFKKCGMPWSQWHRFFGPAKTDYTKTYNSWRSMTLKEWLLYYHKKIIRTKKGSIATWLGVPILKNPLDAWIYQEIIWEVKPDFIIEIGSYDGGSTMFFASLLDLVGNGKVISIDIDRSHYKAKHPRIIEVTGSSSSPDVLSKTRELCGNGKVMISHDGDHQTDRVLEDLNLYADMVTPGSYFVVEDGITDMYRAGEGMSSSFEGGPLLAIEKFIKNRKDFVIDSDRERHLVTYHPSGFLKKVEI